MGLAFWRRDDTAEPPAATRSLSLEEYISYFNYANHLYPYGGLQYTTAGQKEEGIAPTFAGYVQGVYQSSGPVFACILARAALFSEARFQWRQFRNGRPGPLFGSQELAPLETPWPNGTTGDLIVRLEQDYSLAGNFYGRRVRDGIDRMRPDWVTIVLGSNMLPDDPGAALDARVVGYIYHPGGRDSGNEPVVLNVREVCHFTGPTPDPTARFRGTSWLTSLLADIEADKTAVAMKERYFRFGGPNVAVSFEIPDVVEFQEHVARFKEQAEQEQMSKFLFFNSGVPQTAVIGSDMKQMDFKVVQGAGETRIASAAGVPPIIVGFSEGLEAATYSNYQLAMRRFADLTARPMWRMMASCFQSVLTVPSGASLWYDDRDIPALKDDIVNRAEVQAKQAVAAKQFIDAGYEPDSVTDALVADDLSRLEHTGLPTVQVQQQPNGGIPQGNGQAQLTPVARSVLRELETIVSAGEITYENEPHVIVPRGGEDE